MHIFTQPTRMKLENFLEILERVPKLSIFNETHLENSQIRYD